MSFSYTFREGIAGFRRFRLATATSVSALALALVLIGVFVLLGWLGRLAVTEVRQQAGQVEVFLNDVEESEAEALRERLVALTAVDSVHFVSKARALEIFREEFGDEAAFMGDELFLPASYHVRLIGAYANPDSLEAFRARVETWDIVDEIRYMPNLLRDIQRNMRVLSGIGLGVVLLVVIAALLLVGNTIRLSVYARRMLIRTMKLVGATNGFIRRPFLVEGAVQGLLAGILASVAVWGLYAFLTAQLLSVDLLPASAATFLGGSVLVAVGAIILAGLLLGLFASWVSVRRFIRRVQLS